MMRFKSSKRALHALAIFLFILSVSNTSLAGALTTPTTATDPSDFNLQITPSPLVTTVRPGIKSQLELKIRNGSSGVENLKIEPRSFTLGENSTSVDLKENAPADIAEWVTFSAPKFTMQPGQWFSETISINVPKTAGFSYSFALVIGRQSNPSPAAGTRLIKGSVAVFTLINVDRPGATSKLNVQNFSVSKRIYEYLPADLSITFHNTGNTIVQPYGNIFIQRPGSSEPMATIAVNQQRGYILPDATRIISAKWSDGFPSYQPIDKQNPDKMKLVWNWGELSKLRIGRYTAHLVAVYNQAGHDVPIEGSVSFWVIPWKILLCLLLVILLILFALFIMIRAVIRFFRRKLTKQQSTTESPSNPTSDTTDKS